MTASPGSTRSRASRRATFPPILPGVVLTWVIPLQLEGRHVRLRNLLVGNCGSPRGARIAASLRVGFSRADRIETALHRKTVGDIRSPTRLVVCPCEHGITCFGVRALARVVLFA